MNIYLDFLKNNALVRRLTIVQLISYFGAWFTNVAVYTLLLQLNVSVMVIGLVAAFNFLPGALQAPFSGMMIDKFNPKKLMLSLLSIQIVTTFLFIYIEDQSQLIYLFILIFFKMGASSFYFTAEMSLLPRILKRDMLRVANEIHSLIWSVSYTIGMALSGFFVYKFGTTVAFMVDALMFVIAFILIFNLEFPDFVHKKTEKIFTMLISTFTYLKENPKILSLMLLHSFLGFTAYDALVVLIVDHYYLPIIAASLAIGLLNSFRAVGLFIGPLVISKSMNNQRLLYLFIFQALTLFLWAAVLDNFIASLSVSIIVGLSATTLWSYTYTLLQHHSDEKYYGRVVAYNDMFFLLCGAFTAFLIGFLADLNISLPLITVILGCAFLVAALYYFWIKTKYELDEIRG